MTPDQGVTEPPAAPLPPEGGGAAAVFGDRMPSAHRFVEILADTGVSHGLIGPREVPRLWERHVLNCAVIEDGFPEGARVIDVGSGAGLPGVALAIARPDLELHLVEPMLRRTDWLTATVSDLGLDNVTVHRGRAEEFAGTLSAPWVTARAVARTAKLARWCVPLLTDGGTLVAMKGRSAQEELDADRRDLTKLGLVNATLTPHGTDVLDEPTMTLDLTFRRKRTPAKPRRQR
ncbi:16S rRNA m(7)G-527 methyltransferase [Knoellia remsis]|uniref:Ribosomal RNA small subunit methyltransferase G n=1 Tax=Knoellia remsis TaxID=407159 RepID=A0A2T0ULC4_9MICO|nr:16S rRNA m(7)G-527 methyltransferase [Knoellia remsis]